MKLTLPPRLRPRRPKAPSRHDAKAGLVLGLVSIPDGLAQGLLAGLNPVAGLYGYLVGTFFGALSTSSALMSVQATGAMSVIIADVPGLASGPEAATKLATLTILTGLVMLAAGLAGLGALVRYVPHSVLAGFVNAVAINIILGQLADVTGYQGAGENKVTRAVDTFMNVGSFHWPTFAIALLTLALILILERTRLGALGLFVAVVVSSGLVALVEAFAAVETLADVAEVPSGLPTPVMPSLSVVVPLLIPALSLAFVGLVQGAAIGQSTPNEDGTYSNPSGDFRGQGVANIASGFLRGMPVGGSMSATSLLVAAGARGRYGNLIAALVMAFGIVVLGSSVGYVAMPSLAALLMLIGYRTLKPHQIRMVWNTGATQATVMTTTFILTLLIPMQYAVLVGVGISVILFVARQSNRVTVKQWVMRPGSDLPTEVTPPAVLPPDEIVILAPYGSLFFASASVFDNQLPAAEATSTGSVVVIRLRGKEDLGSTFINILVRYLDSLEAVGSHLVLSGISTTVLRQLTNTGTLDKLGRDNVFTATPEIGESLKAALVRARSLQLADRDAGETP